MKLIKKSALALMLGVLILASAASAGYTMNSIGGATSTSFNGGATGSSTSYLQYVDDGTGTLSTYGQLQPTPTGTLGAFQDVLTEQMYVNAHVANGAIGDSSASWDTQGSKNFQQNLPTADYGAGGYISTSLDGTVAASASKSSLNGIADATAYMQAQSAASPQTGVPALGGTGELYASATHNGVGSVLAEASGDSEHSSSIPDLASYAFGHATGDAKVSGSNAVYGGAVSGAADIYAGTSVIGTVGASLTLENINLLAQRGISFAGDSNIQATLSGSEAGETHLQTVNIPAILDTPAVLNQPTVVDNEATSVMDGTATALNRHDKASTNEVLLTETGTDGVNALSDTTLLGTATVNRDSSGSTNKSVAESYTSESSWTGSTLMPGTPADLTTDPVTPAVAGKYVSIEGQNGFTQDGQPSPDAGLGVGAWISTPFIAPVSATAAQVEIASTGPIVAGAIPGVQGLAIIPINNPTATPNPNAAFTVSYDALGAPVTTGVNEQYLMYLNGRTITGVTNDAVGAFNGVGTQTLTESDPTTPAVPANIPPILAGTTMSISQSARNGIEWLEGNNANLLPGHYSTNVVPFGIGQTATTRTSGLIGLPAIVTTTHP